MLSSSTSTTGDCEANASLTQLPCTSLHLSVQQQTAEMKHHLACLPCCRATSAFRLPASVASVLKCLHANQGPQEMRALAAEFSPFNGMCQPGRTQGFMLQASHANGTCSLASVKSKGAKKKRKRDQDDSDEADEFSESDSELGELNLTCHSASLSVCCTDGLCCIRMHELFFCVGYNLAPAVIWLLVSVTRLNAMYTFWGPCCTCDCLLG